jgi:hypothetical protein
MISFTTTMPDILEACPLIVVWRENTQVAYISRCGLLHSDHHLR